MWNFKSIEQFTKELYFYFGVSFSVEISKQKGMRMDNNFDISNDISKYVLVVVLVTYF